MGRPTTGDDKVNELAEAMAYDKTINYGGEESEASWARLRTLKSGMTRRQIKEAERLANE